MDSNQLADNFAALVATLQRLKPASAKGVYMKSITLSSTIGPSVRVDTQDAIRRAEALQEVDMSRAEKVKLVDELTSRLENAPFVALADYRGISVEEVNALRNKFREAGVHYEVIKNKLAKRAIAGSDKEAMNDLLIGMTAWIISGEDPIAAAKVLKAETKELVKKEVFTVKVASSMARSLMARRQQCRRTPE